MNCHNTIVNININPSKLTWFAGTASCYVKLPTFLQFKLNNSYEIAITQIISKGLKRAEICDIGCSLITGSIVDDAIYPLLRRCLLKKGYFIAEFNHRDYMRVTSPEVETFVIYLRLVNFQNVSVDCDSLSVTLHIRECLN